MNHRIVLLLVCAMLLSCAKTAKEPWVLSTKVPITAYKSDPENGKQYLEIIYENADTVDIQMLKIELLEQTGAKVDTVIREVTPEKIVHPKERHLVKRPIGEAPATFNDVMVGRVWIVKE